MERIALANPDLGGNEEKYVLDALRSSWVSSNGPYLARFESEFAAFCSTKAAIAVCNGTVALHLALLAHDLKAGEEVLVPSLTYIATANAVRYCGAEPVFVDVDEANWCIDPLKLEAAITPRSRGIVAVDLYGHPADMDAIQAIADKHKLWVVEDAAEAHGALYKGRKAGSLSSVGTFSFYGNKTLTSGEGGALTLNDPAMEAKIRLLKGQGMDPQRRYFFPVVGYNYRMTNIAAAMLCAQLERGEAILKRRREIMAYYRSKLGAVKGLGLQPVSSWAEPTPWLACATIDPALYGCDRDALMAFLEAEGVETRPFFIPLHSLPPYAELSKKRGEKLPITDRLASQGLNLPTFNAITEAQLARVCDLVIRKAKRA